MDTAETLFDAIDSSTPAQFRAIIEQHPQIVGTPVGEYAELPIHFAAWQDRDAIIEVLLDAGADINTRGDRGQTALHYAAREGCPAAARVLIARGADINALDDTSFSPGFYGIRGRENESVKVAKMLVDAGADVDLNLAVCLHELPRVQKILQSDPDAIEKARFPNDLVLDATHSIETAVFEQLSIDAYGDPAQHLPVIRANDGILRLLLAHGAPTDTPKFGWSPLFQSCQMKHPHITQLLLEHGADPNVQYHGDDLTSVLTCTPCRDEMLEVLTQHGFSSNKA